jgi:hypothetical protein
MKAINKGIYLVLAFKCEKEKGKQKLWRKKERWGS